MIDQDLAELYDVEWGDFIRQVNRNRQRFPEELMFQLTSAEYEELVIQCHWFETIKHSVQPPYVFTGTGVTMLAGILNSERAVKISVSIIRRLIKMRDLVSQNSEHMEKLSELDHGCGMHNEENEEIFHVINEMMADSRGRGGILKSNLSHPINKFATIYQIWYI